MSDQTMKNKEVGSPEKHRWKRDRGDSFTVAGILVWLAFVLAVGNMEAARDSDWWQTWAVGLVGVGAIVLVATALRVIMEETRGRPLGGSVIFGMALFGLGLGPLFGWVWVLPVILIIIATAIVLGAITREN